MHRSNRALQWRSPERRYRPAHHHPALLIELARSRQVADHLLLRHTGLFVDDILRGDAQLSDRQYRQLLHNVEAQKPGAELALLWGRQFFPGHYGALSTLIHNSRHLQQALECIRQYRHLACPLMTPRWVMDERWCYLTWIDSGGAGNTRRFASAAMMAAVYGLFRHRAGTASEWHYYLADQAPKSEADYRANLGDQVRTGAGINLMILPREDLFRQWPHSSETLFTVASHQLSNDTRPVAASGFPEVLYRFLLRTVEQPITLEHTAAAFGISPSSLKRHLSLCDTHFRTLLDEARFHHSLYLSHLQGFSTEQIAERLSNGDRTNFRRSFRRWTGMTPAQYREQLNPGH